MYYRMLQQMETYMPMTSTATLNGLHPMLHMRVMTASNISSLFSPCPVPGQAALNSPVNSPREEAFHEPFKALYCHVTNISANEEQNGIRSNA